MVLFGFRFGIVCLLLKMQSDKENDSGEVNGYYVPMTAVPAAGADTVGGQHSDA